MAATNFRRTKGLELYKSLLLKKKMYEAKKVTEGLEDQMSFFYEGFMLGMDTALYEVSQAFEIELLERDGIESTLVY